MSENVGREPLIEELLAAGWLTQVHWFSDIESTNTTARCWLQQVEELDPGVPSTPALFVADRQSAGRGRSGHPWWSPEGCLMLTLVIDSKLLPPTPADWNQLALVCGVAVADCVEEITGIHCELKWPNDVYLGGRKVAGILIESTTPAGRSRPQHWLVGIGLNVEMDWKSAPPELVAKATCLARESGKPLDIGVVLLELMQQLEHWIVGWATADCHWLEGWQERCLLTGKLTRVRLAGDTENSTVIVGRCEGVNASGQLILRSEFTTQALSSGEVIAWE